MAYRRPPSSDRSPDGSLAGPQYDPSLPPVWGNRDQLISRFGCKGVKFQVYVKDGKAALKATPVG